MIILFVGDVYQLSVSCISKMHVLKIPPLIGVEGGESMSINFGIHYLVVHNVDLNQWCKKYDLVPFTRNCRKCGDELKVNVPFIAQDRRGLCAEPCSCGNKSVPFTYIDFNFPCTPLEADRDSGD
jgi:hypothetical protein